MWLVLACRLCRRSSCCWCLRPLLGERRLEVPYPILQVLAGPLLSVLPGMPRIGLDPNLMFLPPLLYSAAWTLSWRGVPGEL
jgi:NhaP-type Na+/H+ or K+/H+ antiporter